VITATLVITVFILSLIEACIVLVEVSDKHDFGLKILVS